MAKEIEIKDSDGLTKILQIFSSLDDVRWSAAGNYNLINYCTNDLTPDEKLLSHWLCYVTDRQTDFRRIWEVAGYVISHLVRAFTREKSKVDAIFGRHIRYPSGNKETRLECPLASKNSRLAYYDIETEPVQFASRYMPSDAVSILRTLIILDETAGRSFTRYMRAAVQGISDHRTAIRRLAAALQFLTYDDIGQVKGKTVKKRLEQLSGELASDITDYLKAPSDFIDKLVKRFKPWKKKRLWCSIRDYLKSPEFNDDFVAALSKIDSTEAKRWGRNNTGLKQALDAMELPGDVWNNNRLFRDGLFSSRLGPVPKTWDMPRIARAIHAKLQGKNFIFYPEQLDVTFDFVQGCAMCVRATSACSARASQTYAMGKADSTVRSPWRRVGMSIVVIRRTAGSRRTL